MKILLCQPPVQDFYTTPDRHYPLGLISLAGYIKDLPVSCKIADFLHANGRKTIPLPKNFEPIRYLLPYEKSPIKIFHHYYHFGMAWNNIASFFKRESPDVIGVSSLFYTYSFEVIKILQLARTACPQAIIVVGGQNVRDGLFSLQEDIPADYAIIGEGEIPFRALVEYLLGYRKALSNVPGLINLKDTPFIPKDLQIVATPCEKITPDHSLLKSEKYTIGGIPAAMIQTSRGCPYGCGFCTIARTFGKTLRYRPVSHVLEEIETLIKRGIKAFDFEDDNLTANRDFAMQLLKDIQLQYGDSLRLYAMNGLSTWTLDEILLKNMRQAGFVMVNLSLGTLSQKALKNSGRQDTHVAFENTARYAARLGMKVMGYFIAGLPGERFTDMLETLRFLSRLPLIIGISPFYYVPAQQLTIPHIPSNPRDARLTRFYPSHNEITEEELITLFRFTRGINFLKGKMKANNIDSCRFIDLQKMFANDPVVGKILYDFQLSLSWDICA